MTAAAMSVSPASDRHGGALKLHRRATFGEVSSAPVEPHNRAIPPIVDDGAVLAIKYLRLGGSALLPAAATRGGARNRADRVSHALNPSQVASLIAARLYADTIGLPLNRMITIHWQAADVALACMPKATGRFTDLMAKTIARHGCKTAWGWVHENSGVKGGHCHLLAHVPADLVSLVTDLQRGWLRRITGKKYRARVILSKPVGGRLGLEVGNPSLHAVNLDVALAYVLKGASPEAASLFDLKLLESGGCVIGKRCGTSQNIGAKARKAKE